MTTLADSYAWCKSLSRRTAGNFYFSFLTLPGDRFRDMCALYAFMRITDDLGDDLEVPLAERAARLLEWRADLHRALAGENVDHPVYPALLEMIQRHGVPPEYLFAVIDGVRMDLEPAAIETFDELLHYCYHVAGAVGLCCIHVWGFHDARAVDLAIDCGRAFQLTNILRDLGEDIAAGRVYLPEEDLRRFDYSRRDLAARCCDERFLRLMEFEVDRAKEYYARAQQLYGYLDPPGRPIYAAMLQIYGGLLHEIERRRYNVFRRRVNLPRWRKLLISANAIVRHRWLVGAGGRHL